jgi:integrase
MANVIERNGSWYVKFKDAAGRWKRVVTTAKSKAEARRLATEMEQRAERERFGLEERPSDCTLTLGQLCEWWLENRCPKRSHYIESKRLGKHVLKTKLGGVPLKVLTADHVENQLRAMEKAGLGPVSLNGLRGTLFTVFTRARKAKKWVGVNPIIDVESRRVPKKVYVTLRADEVPLLLAHVPDEWRDLFVTGLYSAMRKGELCGLKKTNLDFQVKEITIAHSYDYDSSKGGHQDVIPMAEPLVPYLKAAVAASPSEYVFPAADGSMRTKEADPEKVLRRALARAGLVDGYEHICRRCKAREQPHVERHPDNALRKCPACGMKLWPKALPRKMRFHDLRHTTATLLLRAGVDLHRVQRILRHKDVKLTADTYAHLQIEDLRPALGALPVTPPPSDEVVDAEYEIFHGDASDRTPHGPPVVHDGQNPKNKAPGPKDFSQDSEGLNWSGRQDLNLRPLGPEPSALPG